MRFIENRKQSAVTFITRFLPVFSFHFSEKIWADMHFNHKFVWLEKVFT